MPLGGVIFDWDGVVIDSASLHEKSWELLAEELMLELPDNHFTLGFGKKNDFIIPKILQWSQDQREIEEWGKRKEELYRKLGESIGISILDGIKNFLNTLHNNKIPCVIGTSTERKNLDLAFSQLNIGHFFEGAICSDDVSKGKPNPEVFFKAAQKIKQKPEDCVVLEDSTGGIEAAKAGGMKAVGLLTTQKNLN